MQFSSNSNEGIRALIRACPALVGQYRQAVLQRRDRLQSLEEYRFSLRRYQARLKLKQVAKIRLEKQLEETVDDLDKEELAAKLELAQAIADETEYKMVQAADLVEDAIREVAICNEELERITHDAGIDFEHLDSVSFQELMVSEFRLKRSRWIAARLMGLPPEGAEALLDIPDDERGLYLTEVFRETTNLQQALMMAEVGTKQAIAPNQPEQLTLGGDA